MIVGLNRKIFQSFNPNSDNLNPFSVKRIELFLNVSKLQLDFIISSLLCQKIHIKLLK